jgi:hypothetical protein
MRSIAKTRYRIGQLPQDLREYVGRAAVSCHPYFDTDDEDTWVLFFIAEAGQLYLEDVIWEDGTRVTVPEWEEHHMTDHDLWELMVNHMRDIPALEFSL